MIIQIKDFLATNLNAPKHLDGKKVLTEIEVQQGILVQRAEKIYSFSHLTLQEYLTAQYIVDKNLIEYLVSNHLTDTRWQEVFLLVAGLMRGGADELLLLMEKQAIDYLDTPVGKQKLIPILNWAENITRGSTGDLKPVAKRAIAYAIDQMVDYIEELAKLPEIFKDVNLTLLIAQLKTFKTKIPDDNQPREIRQKFGLKIIETFQSAFHLTPELIKLSRQEVKEIDRKYFYIYNLMLKCKTAALTIEEQTWSEIEERMLRVTQ